MLCAGGLSQCPKCGNYSVGWDGRSQSRACYMRTCGWYSHQPDSASVEPEELFPVMGMTAAAARMLVRTITADEITWLFNSGEGRYYDV